MRRTMLCEGLFAALALCVASQARATVEIERAPGKAVFKFHLDDVHFDRVIVEGQAFVKATLKGVDGYEGVRFQEGKPELPVVRFFVDGSGPVTVEMNAGERQRSFLLDAPALPSILSLPKIAGAKRQLKLVKSAYDDAKLQPAVDYEVQTIGLIRGVPRQMVTVYPVKYWASSNTWAIKSDIAVTFTADAGPQPNEHPTDASVMALVIGEQFQISAALDAFRALKAEQGIKTITMVMEKGKTKPDDVRNWLRQQYKSESNLRYALIVGDIDDVPAREATEISGVTDLFYAALDTDDYRADIGTPDIGVGRFSVSSESDLATVVEKTAKYERGAFTDKSWLNKIEWIATDDSANYAIAEGSFNYAIDHYTKVQGHVGSFPEALQAGGDQLYAISHDASTEDVVARMREGRGLINYGGHGSTSSWAGPAVGEDEVARLDHPDALPMVISNACITGDFTQNSFAEIWLKAPHGAVAFWGSMDSTYWDEDDILQRRLYDFLFRDKITEFSTFAGKSLAEVWRFYGGAGRSKYYFETYLNFGDPSLNVRLSAN